MQCDARARNARECVQRVDVPRIRIHTESMKLRAFLLASLFACGGKSQSAPPTLPPDPVQAPEPSAEVMPPQTPEPAPQPDVPLEPPAPAAAPKVTSAQVELAPIAGNAKMKPVMITIEQTEGQPAKIAEVEIEGLRPGKYQLLVHDAASCKDSSKIPTAEPSNQILVEVTKDAPGKLPATELDMKLEGDLIGKTLVLHELRAGTPGPAQACGAIISKIDAADPNAGG